MCQCGASETQNFKLYVPPAWPEQTQSDEKKKKKEDNGVEDKLEVK